ncbi:MAG: metallophosphoesterase [Cyanothece sp. SIO2G6]|nr:metallophosphoesterase [Cyanothece sp. SIO2G6]
MSLNFRFAIASDLHIAQPHTIPDNPYRFHRVEISLDNFHYVMDQLRQLDLDFVLIPGDLTQDGEPDNHAWLSHELAQLPFPVYVIPGNHDAKERDGTDFSISMAAFPGYYEKFGYGDRTRPYYSCCPLPGLRLIGLNSIFFDDEGKQTNAGRMDSTQLDWLRQVLAETTDERVFVMIHHNVLEHLVDQSTNRLGQRYMLENAAELLEILHGAGVQLVFTGHLHVQDVARQIDPATGNQLFDITTGSLVSYPHPFRILHYRDTDDGVAQLRFESHRIPSAPGWDDLQGLSREFMSDRSTRFIRRLLTDPPLNLTEAAAEPLLPALKYFWSNIADGDAQFDFSQLPSPVQTYFEAFSATELWDNHSTLELKG